MANVSGKFFDKSKSVKSSKVSYSDSDQYKLWSYSENIINNLRGFLSFDKNEIYELSLESQFANKKNIKFTIKSEGEEKITTFIQKKLRE